MKLMSYVIKEANEASYGIYKDGYVVDVKKRIGEEYPDLRSVLIAQKLDLIRSIFERSPDYCIDELSYLPVIPNPGKIYCVGGMNYHREGVSVDAVINAPTLFIRFSDTLTGNNCSLSKPICSSEFDFEGELAVIIGSPTYQVKRGEALKHVAGYSCFMDGSVRDMQYTWFTAGKNWINTAGFGPWLVTVDEVGNPHSLNISTYLNGVRVQHDTTGSMVRGIPEIIEYISSFSPLLPGDVIITGSPDGVGKNRIPPLYMFSGDVVEVEISKLGRLVNFII